MARQPPYTNGIGVRIPPWNLQVREVLSTLRYDPDYLLL